MRRNLSLSTKIMEKYGPSNFDVSPVVESPTTMGGRMTIAGSSRMDCLTRYSASCFVDSRWFLKDWPMSSSSS